MNITKKIISTVIAIVLFGVIITVLYENGDTAPGDGIIGFILFGGLIAVIVFIWWSKPDKKNTTKEQVLSSEEITLEIQCKNGIKKLDLELKEEIKSLHQKYEAEYARLEKRYTTTDKKTDTDFIALEKELDERYMKISTAIGDKYSDLKNKLYVDLFNSIAKIHYEKKRIEGRKIELSPGEKTNIAMAGFMNQTVEQKIQFDFNNGLLTQKEVQQIEEAVKSGNETLAEAYSRILTTKSNNWSGLKNKHVPKEYNDFDDE